MRGKMSDDLDHTNIMSDGLIDNHSMHRLIKYIEMIISGQPVPVSVWPLPVIRVSQSLFGPLPVIRVSRLWLARYR